MRTFCMADADFVRMLATLKKSMLEEYGVKLWPDALAFYLFGACGLRARSIEMTREGVKTTMRQYVARALESLPHYLMESSEIAETLARVGATFVPLPEFDRAYAFHRKQRKIRARTAREDGVPRKYDDDDAHWASDWDGAPLDGGDENMPPARTRNEKPTHSVPDGNDAQLLQGVEEQAAPDGTDVQLPERVSAPASIDVHLLEGFEEHAADVLPADDAFCLDKEDQPAGDGNDMAVSPPPQDVAAQTQAQTLTKKKKKRYSIVAASKEAAKFLELKERARKVPDRFF